MDGWIGLQLVGWISCELRDCVNEACFCSDATGQLPKGPPKQAEPGLGWGGVLQNSPWSLPLHLCLSG